MAPRWQVARTRRRERQRSPCAPVASFVHFVLTLPKTVGGHARHGALGRLGGHANKRQAVVQRVATVALRNVNGSSDFGLLSPKTREATHAQLSDKRSRFHKERGNEESSIKHQASSIKQHPTTVATRRRLKRQHNPKETHNLRLLSPTTHQATQVQRNDRKRQNERRETTNERQ